MVKQIPIILFFCLLIVFHPTYSDDSYQVLPDDAIEWMYQMNYDNFTWYIIAFEYNKKIYLPFNEVLSAVKIYSLYDTSRTTHGYFFDQDSTFEINIRERYLKRSNRTFQLMPDDFIANNLEVFVNSSIFNQLLDIQITINKPDLTFNLKSDVNLPVLNEYERKKKNNSTYKSQPANSTNILNSRKFVYLDANNLQYSLSGNKLQEEINYRYDLLFNGVLLGGDLVVQSNGSYMEKYQRINNNNVYIWNKIFKKNNYLTKLSLGNVIAGITIPSRIQAYGNKARSLYGIKLSNFPNKQEQIFSDFNFQEYCGQNWQGEIYINNRLISQTNADENGIIHNNIPLNYGNTNIQLKYYGPYGESKEFQQNIYVTPEFIKPGKVQYEIAGGTDIYSDNLYSSTKLQFGVTNWFTNSVFLLNNFNNSEYNFLNHSSFRIFGNYCFNLDIAPNDYYSGTINYYTEEYGTYDFSFVKPLNGHNDYADFNNYRIQFLMHLPKFDNLPFRIAFRGNRYKELNRISNNFNAYLSTNISGLNLSSNYNYNFSENDGYSISRQNLSFRAGYHMPFIKDWLSFIDYMSINTITNYDISNNRFQNLNLSINQRLFEICNLIYTHNIDFETGISSNNLGISLDLGFIRSHTTSNFTPDGESYYQSLMGNITYNSNSSSLGFNRSFMKETGTSDINIRFFIDENINGKYDESEELLEGIMVLADNMFSVHDRKNSVTTLKNLEPYKHYDIKVDIGSIKNPVIKPKYEEFAIETVPNSNELIEIPCYKTGFIEGEITLVEGDSRKGQSGVKLHLTNHNDGSVKTVKVFSDGSFYDMGLMPGYYTAEIDSVQLGLLDVVCNPPKLEFELNGGDFAEGLNFELEPKGFEYKFDKLVKRKDSDPKDSPSLESGTLSNKASTPDNNEEQVFLSHNFFPYTNKQEYMPSKGMVAYLKGILEMFEEKPEADILVAAYIKQSGDREADTELIAKRVDVVANYLIEKGVPKENIITKSEIVDKQFSNMEISDEELSNGIINIQIIE